MKRADGKLIPPKKIYLETGRSKNGMSQIFTSTFPKGQSSEKTPGYKAIVEDISYILLKQNGELTGRTQKGAITTTIYVDRRRWLILVYLLRIIF